MPKTPLVGLLGVLAALGVLVGCSPGSSPSPAAVGTSTTIAGSTTSASAAPVSTTLAPVLQTVPTIPTSTATSSPTATPDSTTTTVATTTTTTPGSTTTSNPQAARNLVVTDNIRAQLLAAGAALNNLPTSDYTGLTPGATYYAYDPVTSTYWAAAGLAPSPSSLPAQVAAQDDGSYLLFSEPAGGTWTAVDDGLGGVGGTPCPAIPPEVVAVWGWPAGTCRPPQ